MQILNDVQEAGGHAIALEVNLALKFNAAKR